LMSRAAGPVALAPRERDVPRRLPHGAADATELDSKSRIVQR
jgi:hypothetical protein